MSHEITKEEAAVVGALAGGGAGVAGGVLLGQALKSGQGSIITVQPQGSQYIYLVCTDTNKAIIIAAPATLWKLMRDVLGRDVKTWPGHEGDVKYPMPEQQWTAEQWAKISVVEGSL